MSDAPSGVLVVDKPQGRTSHQVVSRVRWLLGTRKVGHAGTLDPMATGVLVVGIGRGTRLMGHLALHDKRYVATVRLGESTDTDDADGTIISSHDASGLTAAGVEKAAAAYRGEIDQVPSSVSAIRIDGKRAYDRVRAGEQVTIEPRRVTIERLDILDVRAQGARVDVDIDVECSSGTYIRSIARDLGRDLGVGGHLTRLRRTRVGAFDLTDAVDVYASDDRPSVMSLAAAVQRAMPVRQVSSADATLVAHGRMIEAPIDQSPTGIIGPDGRLLALYGPSAAGTARPVAVFVGAD